jgi:hypothetical protein
MKLETEKRFGAMCRSGLNEQLGLQNLPDVYPDSQGRRGNGEHGEQDGVDRKQT